LIGGEGDGCIFLSGNDEVEDVIVDNSGDRGDTIEQFSPGRISYRLQFNGIQAIDVGKARSHTEFRVADSISGNRWFGSGIRIVTLNDVTGLSTMNIDCIILPGSLSTTFHFS
jgi:hypothetical protein